MESDEKVCPRCAETVKVAALICKHCNYEFGAPLKTASAAAERPKKSSFKVGCLTVIGILVVLAVIGSFLPPSPNSGDSTTAGTSAPEEAAISVTAEQLAAAYDSNEVAAQNTYGDKTLDVTGTVTGVTLDLFNNPVLQLRAQNEFLPVQAKFDGSYKSALANIGKGDTVTIRCRKITEVISAPMLSECTGVPRKE
ncbi:MAG TPA: zinc ribbon domain-containing protein [Rhizomicrobium sp.]|nr:zinc ribbon domain-containing protein [Rhizomicrobium sp.]